MRCRICSPCLPRMRTSLHVGVFAPSPAADWMARHGMIAQEVSDPIQSGDPGAYPGQRSSSTDLVQGKLDAAFVWGPIAGYFGKQMPDAGLHVVPLHSESRVRFDYPIAMGVRYGEPQWKQQVQQLIADHRGQIDSILADYGVPLLKVETASKKPDND